MMYAIGFHVLAPLLMILAVRSVVVGCYRFGRRKGLTTSEHVCKDVGMSFHTEKYRTTRTVLVVFEDDMIIDQIKGMNTGHALHRARINWAGGQVFDLGPVDDTLTFEDAEKIAHELKESE